jgi:hypothetical protein
MLVVLQRILKHFLSIQENEMKLLVAVAATSLALTSALAHATVIATSFGVTDTVAGLDWLSLANTTNMSLVNVRSQLGSGGTFAGWTVASDAQVKTLFTDATGLPFPTAHTTYALGNTVADESAAAALALALGNTMCTANLGLCDGYSSIFHTEGFTSDLFGTSTTSYDIADIVGYITPSGSYVGQSHVPNTTFPQTTAAAYFGTFLVRDTPATTVPEPSVIALVGLGLLGMGVARKAKYRA